MIEAKYRYENETKWNLKDFNSEEEMLKEFEEDSKVIEEYKSRPKKVNPIKNWWTNLRSTKKNWNKVRASPYASLSLALKARKIIIGLLIPYIAYMIVRMVLNFNVGGVMGLFQRLLMIGIGIFLCWKIYQTIPQAQKQIEYYKKFPHTINYCPTNTKETVDDILKKIENNKKEVKNDRIKKESITKTTFS